MCLSSRSSCDSVTQKKFLFDSYPALNLLADAIVFPRRRTQGGPCHFQDLQYLRDPLSEFLTSELKLPHHNPAVCALGNAQPSCHSDATPNAGASPDW
jgi:hypothetical protein